MYLIFVDKVVVYYPYRTLRCYAFFNQWIFRYKLERLYDCWNLSGVRGTRWRSWLRRFATSPNVAGSTPCGIIWIFHWLKPSGRTMAVGSTRPVTEISTIYLLWGFKAAGSYVWLAYHLRLPFCRNSGSINLLESWGPVKACTLIAFTQSKAFLTL